LNPWPLSSSNKNCTPTRNGTPQFLRLTGGGTLRRRPVDAP
jgi:hypothetical protein